MEIVQPWCPGGRRLLTPGVKGAGDSLLWCPGGLMLFTPGVQGTWDLSPLDTGHKFAHPWVQGAGECSPLCVQGAGVFSTLVSMHLEIFTPSIQGAGDYSPLLSWGIV